MKKASQIILLSFAGCLFALGSAMTSPAFSMASASSGDLPVIEAGEITSFSRNAGNLNDGVYFTMDKNAAPYNSSEWVSYYATSSSCVTLKRDGVTYHLALDYDGSSPRNIIQKYGETGYYLRTISGWTCQAGILPLKPYDEVTISGTFFNESCYLKIDTSSFKLDDSGDIECTTVIKNTLEVVGGVSGNNLSGSSSRGIYYTSSDHNLKADNSWGIRYHAVDSNNNLAVINDLTYTHYSDPSTDGYIVALDDDRWYIDLWIMGHTFEEGEILYLSGQYFYKDAKTDTKYQFTLTNGAFLFHVANGNTTVSLLTNYGTYFYNKLNSRFDIDVYSSGNQETIFDTLHEFKIYCQDEHTFKEIYEEYVTTAKFIDSLEKDEAAVARKISVYRSDAVNEMTAYPDYSLYLPEQVTAIHVKLNDMIKKVNASSSLEEINGYVTSFKNDVDSISTRETIYCQKVLANNPAGSTSINTEYLETYDTLSLHDINQTSSITLTSETALVNKNPNSDTTYDEYDNTYCTSEDNTSGSVAFRFLYTVGGENLDLGVSVKLRGIQYYGYKFLLNETNYGVYFKRTVKNQESKENVGSVNNCFASAGTYLVEVGAVDIEDTDKVYMYMMKDGVLLYGAICDKTPYSFSRRIDIKAERASYASHKGSVTISDTDTSANYGGVHLGRFNVISNDNRTVLLSADANSLPYSADKTLNSYPLSASCVRIERDGQTRDIADPNSALLHKYSDYAYSFDYATILSSPQNNDRLIIEGYFASYTSDSDVKTAYYVSRTVLVYKDGIWNKEAITLAEAKEDAVYDFDHLAKADDYTEENYASVTEIITNGKAAIEAATSLEEVDSVYLTVIGEVEEIPTLLETRQNTAVSEMTEYTEEIKDDYYETEYQEILTSLEEHKTAVLTSETAEEVDIAEKDFYQDIATIHTKTERDLAELNEAKEDAISNIREQYGKCHVDGLSEAKAKELNAYVHSSIDEISSAQDKETVNRIYNEVINRLNSTFVHTVEVTNVNVGLIVGLSAGGAAIVLAAIGLTLFYFKRKKTKRA